MSAQVEVVRLPKFWCTAVAKVLVGEQPCLLSAWAPAHLKLQKASRDDVKLAQWKVEHTALLNATHEQMKAEGWKCSVERFWQVKGQAAIISGKSDLVLQAPDRRPVVVDCKGGDARDSDVAQVLIYMAMLPLAWGSPQMQFDGRVVYKDRVVTIEHAKVEAFRPRLMAVMKRLGSAVRPDAQPGRDACQFCSVPATECAVRHTTNDEGETVEF